jgi:alpha-amylase
MHNYKIRQLFGMTPQVFRNTELIYSDDIGKMVNDLGFKGVFTDGHDSLLGLRSPHHLYEHPECNALKIFFRSYRLSDDITFRFNQKEWKKGMLTPKKYMQWLESIPEKENLVTLGLDYETFGEHHKKETGIFKFLEGLITSVATHKNYEMVTPSEAIASLSATDSISVPSPTSWADHEHDLSAWLGNEMQQDAFETVKSLEPSLKKIGNVAMINIWRYLQTSDHFYYMSTKTGDDGNIHNYFSPYASPYEAFMNYMNVISDFSNRVNEQVQAKNATHSCGASIPMA